MIKAIRPWIYLTLILLFIACTNHKQGQSPSHEFALGDSVFLLDGKPFQMISGEMHYTRIPPENWRDRMKMAKAMGLNTIGTYVFWNAHEPLPGKYDFSGNNDIAGFVKAAREEGLWVVLRPSPYACAEWEFGGYPWWLLKDSTVKVRSKDPRFVDAYTRYITELSRHLVPQLVTNGGNILMVQLENEYGSYSDDKSYLELNRKIFSDAGFNCLFFTCDGADKMVNGHLPGILPAVNGLEDTAAVKKLIRDFHQGKGPFYVAEWYPGWFDNWGKPHANISDSSTAAKLDQMLAAGLSVNMYMFHGGTTRDFMNGANMNVNEPYRPQVSSYDYDAPLDEAGNPTEKYFRFREVIAKHLPGGESLPPVPAKSRTIAIEGIKFTHYASPFDQLPEPVKSKTPLSFEDLGQAYGFVLYRTTIDAKKIMKLKINGLRDFAIVYVDGKQNGVLDRSLQSDSAILTTTGALKTVTLDLWVENNGRVNYGPYLVDNRKGILGPVHLDGKELYDWQMYSFPFTDLHTLKFQRYSGHSGSAQPAFYKAWFQLDDVGDTYLKMTGFGKGFVYLNGHNLGKYWMIGPQQTIYVPASWLRKGRNEIVVFDELNFSHMEISSILVPMLDGPLLNPASK